MSAKPWIKTASLALLLVVGGAVSAWLIARWADRGMRADLLHQTQSVARLVDAAQLRTLTATEADLGAPAYKQLKSQLASLRSANPQCRFLYLLGSKPDGSVVFFADSEPPDSRDFSPPGQVYDEASPECRDIFISRGAIVEGPSTDRWGSWVSALVPVTDPLTGDVIAVMGADIQAKNWRWDVVAKSALPVGFLLLLLVGAATVLVSARRDNPQSNLWAAGFLLAVGLVVTAIAAFYQKSEAEMNERRGFDSACGEIQSRIENRLATREEILRGAAAFFADDDGVTRQEWHEFAEHLQIYENLSGIQGIGFAPLVPAGQLAQHLAEIRAEGFPDYQIRPPGEREFYAPVVFLEPFYGRNLMAFGHDMLSEPVRRTAMEWARDHNAAALTGKLALAQEPGEDTQAGVVMYMPVYRMRASHDTVAERRSALLGWVGSPYRMNDLMEGIVGPLDVWHEWHIRLRIFDGETDAPDALLYDSLPGEGEIPADALTLRIPINVGARDWLLSFTQSGEGGALVAYSKVWLTLGAGTVISLLVAGLVLSLRNTQLDAKKIADRLTADLRLSEAKLSETAERLALAAKAAKVGVWDYDVAAGSLGWDAQMLSLYGITPDQFARTYDSWKALVHPDDRMRGDAEIQMALRGEKEFDTEFRVVWPDGTVHNIRALAAVHRSASGQAVRLVGMNWDITEQKQAESSILRINSQLEEAKAAAEKASAAKSEFLANMSHEIRTPMAAVIGLSDLLSDTALSALQSDYVRRINVSSTALLGVLGDILDYSKIEAGHMQIEAVPLRFEEILNKCKALFEVHAGSKGLALRFELDPGVPAVLIGDPLRLLQVINNLVNNALKFTKSGGVDVAVQCLGTTEREALVKVCVKDTGIGIPLAHRDKLFAAFQQADYSTTRKYGGTGLGLTISKRLVDLMGGEIGVESEPGRGSTFWFTVRLGLPHSSPMEGNEAPQSERSAVEPVQIAAPIRGARVLLVDDSLTNVLVTKAYLRKLGLEVEAAQDGQAAVDKAKQTRFDAILMDLQMPGIDGFTAARMIRANEVGRELGIPEVPIIALTAAATLQDEHAAEDAGMNDYLTKPVDLSNLASTLARWIPSRS